MVDETEDESLRAFHALPPEVRRTFVELFGKLLLVS